MGVPRILWSFIYPIVAGLKIPQDLAKELFDEFWKQFAGVRKWQRWLGNRYNELGYAEPYSGGGVMRH